MSCQEVSKRNNTSFTNPGEVLKSVVKFAHLQRMNNPEVQDFRETTNIDSIAEQCLYAEQQTVKRVCEVLFIATARHMSGYSASDITNDGLRPVSKSVMNTEFFQY